MLNKNFFLMACASVSALTLAGCLDLDGHARPVGTEGTNDSVQDETSPNNVADYNAGKIGDTGRYIVKYDERRASLQRSNGTFSTRSADHILSRAGGASSLMHLSSLQASVAELSEEQVEQLRNEDAVAYVEPDPVRYLLAEDVPYGIPRVQADQLSDAAAVNTTVCIIDSGYDINHPDLPNSGVTGSVTSQYAGNWNNDGNGHGTHVAGTIAALGGNGIGVVGVNPSAQLGLHIVKIFNNNGDWAYGSDLIRAIEQCSDSGATVVNMSLGGPGSSQSERQAMQTFYNNGMLLVAAAGNDGNNRYSYPASYDSVYSVAATDSNNSRANFSQYNNQVEIAAPGVGVRSTIPGGRYAYFNGTSMATPHVAGVAALVWSNNQGCSAQDVRNALNSTAVDLGSAGRDIYFGHGLIQAKAAHDYLQQQGCSTDTTEPVLIDLDSGVAVSNLADTKAAPDNVAYRIAVPAGATQLDIQISGGSGDSDLYVKHGEEPSQSSYDCRPYRQGNNELCSFSHPQQGDWYIVLDPYTDFSGVTLMATVEAPTGGGISEQDDDLSADKGQWLRYTQEVTAGDSKLSISIARGEGDADLYVRHGADVSRKTYDCRPFKDGNEESCVIDNPAEGTWYIGVHGYEGFEGLSLIRKIE
ncbi:S8 family serine peptidase [Saccharospirillum alexandrii]|uniref:S8 family serine peptidase n=1 Tax=Saccharospirillum alexandrii TaxID=2448477 RepID=UPI0037356D2A